MKKIIIKYIINRVTIVIFLGALSMGKACFGDNPYINMWWILLGIIIILFGGAYVCEECNLTEQEKKLLKFFERVLR
jgi:hypothetical protein